MRVRFYESENDLAIIRDVFNTYNAKYYPNESKADIEKIKMYMSNFWKDTKMEEDLFFIIDDFDEICGFAGFLKNETKAFWTISCAMFPAKETHANWDFTISNILEIAQQQNAPEIRFNSVKTQTILNEVLNKHNIEIHHYMYSLYQQKLDTIPNIEVPSDITVRTLEKVTDKLTYVKMMNEAYKDVDDWIPDTVETFDNLEEMRTKKHKIWHHLAYKGDQLVGACDVADSPDDSRNRFINSLGVSSQFQHKGVGSALMKAVLTDLKERGSSSVNFIVSGKNEKDIALPRKFGFQEDPEKSIVVYRFKP